MSKASFIPSTRNVENKIEILLDIILSQSYEGEIEVLIMD